VAEHGLRWNGEPEVDGVAELVAGEAEFERDRFVAAGALDGLFAVAHGSRDVLGAGPQGARESAFTGERSGCSVAGCLGEQPKRSVHARLSAAIGAGDHGERAEGEYEPA